MQGQLVATQEILSDQDKDSEISMENIPSGIYTVYIKMTNTGVVNTIYIE